ncbi:PLP-dependent aminotransferase family protein [Pelagibaculum spongiae]|uniref:GntR family transcriptional regulator n=1 Tax=Pelagibaculum spongiae TaxID=2080658 RepID=A0A2V1GW28_9GAMM|nr:PLP-dependent aminotransferase family protein [Pelagibaculum spongiae]PVZ68158.1 GntR family transcriptional regulator [Pelagibaculum spongiae]
MQPADHLQNMSPSYIREILKAATAENVISLAGGLPAAEHFPMALLQQPLQQISQSPELFQYGATAGYQPLLDFCAEHYQLETGNSGLITTGSQQGLDLIARAFLNPGDGVAMEAPCYLGALQVFELAKAELFTVEQSDSGPDLVALEQLFAKGNIKIFYAVPDFHNPTGRVWPLAARQAVAKLCQRYKVGLIEDAPYRELRYHGDALPMVSSFCPEQAWILRSFSKIALPGIRLAFISGPQNWIDPLIKIKQASDLHSPIPLQALLLGLLKSSEFNNHLLKLREQYAERYQALSGALDKYLGDKISFQQVEGGMFLWLELNQKNDQPINTMKLAERALENNVAVVPGEVFYPVGQLSRPALRLNFSHASPQQLEIAIQRLVKAFDRQ